MSLKLMFITNNPLVAKIAEDSGVDRIWIDLEYIGKEARQNGRNTVKSMHSPKDVANLRPYIVNSELMVRVNPLYSGSKQEIDEVISNGASIIMLPMFRTTSEVSNFVELVNARAKVMLLVETVEAIENIKRIVKIPGIDEIHIGLNDLHIAYGLNFMFELLTNGTIEKACRVIRMENIPYGFGGIAKLGEGLLPAECIIGEHYRLGSSMVILSRSFCDTKICTNENELKSVFNKGINDIREYEMKIRCENQEYYLNNKKKVKEIVNSIVQEIERKRE